MKWEEGQESIFFQHRESEKHQYRGSLDVGTKQIGALLMS